MKRLAVGILAVAGVIHIVDYACYLATKTKDEKYKDIRNQG